MVGVRVKPSEDGLRLGQMLRAAREERGIVLEDAAAASKLPIKQLTALEEGDFSLFSAEVYIRGAFRQYAAYLGLDDKQSQRALLRVLSPSRVHVPLRLHTPERWWQRMQHPRVVVIGITLLVALSAGSYITWQLRAFWELPDLSITDPQGSVLDEEEITVRGVSETGAAVTVNEETVLLQSDRTFAVTMRAHPGINIVRIRAENAAGRVRTVEKHLLLPRG